MIFNNSIWLIMKQILGQILRNLKDWKTLLPGKGMPRRSWTGTSAEHSAQASAFNTKDGDAVVCFVLFLSVPMNVLEELIGGIILIKWSPWVFFRRNVC